MWLVQFCLWERKQLKPVQPRDELPASHCQKILKDLPLSSSSRAGYARVMLSALLPCLQGKGLGCECCEPNTYQRSASAGSWAVAWRAQELLVSPVFSSALPGLPPSSRLSRSCPRWLLLRALAGQCQTRL